MGGVFGGLIGALSLGCGTRVVVMWFGACTLGSGSGIGDGVGVAVEGRGEVAVLGVGRAVSRHEIFTICT